MTTNHPNRGHTDINPNDIDVDVFGGPPGSAGFRRGTWTAEYGGQSYTLMASIPHALEFDEQRARLQREFAHAIENGYAKPKAA